MANVCRVDGGEEGDTSAHSVYWRQMLYICRLLGEKLKDRETACMCDVKQTSLGSKRERVRSATVHTFAVVSYLDLAKEATAVDGGRKGSRSTHPNWQQERSFPRRSRSY